VAGVSADGVSVCATNTNSPRRLPVKWPFVQRPTGDVHSGPLNNCDTMFPATWRAGGAGTALVAQTSEAATKNDTRAGSMRNMARAPLKIDEPRSYPVARKSDVM
jgi:hypothetical protein